MRFARHKGRKAMLCCMLGLLACMITSCSAPLIAQQHATIHARPTVVMAGGEPILPHSQIFFHDAPLPTQADFRFGSDAWTLAGHDSNGTHSVGMPSCCFRNSAIPLWFAA